MDRVDYRRGLARDHLVEVGADAAAGAGSRQRVAAAAAVAGEDLGARTARNLGRRRARHAGVLADIGGDVLEVLAGDQPGGHRDRRVVRARPRVLDLGGVRPRSCRCPCRLRGPRRRPGRGWGRSPRSCRPAPSRDRCRILDEEDAAAIGIGVVGPAAGADDPDAATVARARRGRMGFGDLGIGGREAPGILYVGEGGGPPSGDRAVR